MKGPRCWVRRRQSSTEEGHLQGGVVFQLLSSECSQWEGEKIRKKVQFEEGWTGLGGNQRSTYNPGIWKGKDVQIQVAINSPLFSSPSNSYSSFLFIYYKFCISSISPLSKTNWKIISRKVMGILKQHDNPLLSRYFDMSNNLLAYRFLFYSCSNHVNISLVVLFSSLTHQILFF